MMGEFNIYGVYVPVLLVYAALAYVLLLLVRKILNRLFDETWFVSPSLVYLSFYCILVWALHTLHVHFV